MKLRWWLPLCLLPTAAGADDARFGVEDIVRLAEVSEPAISPDGRYVAYTVGTANPARDEPQSDLWRGQRRDLPEPGMREPAIR